MKRYTATGARRRFGEVLDRVARRKQRILIERRGKAAAVLLPAEEAELFETLLACIDLKEVRRALRRSARPAGRKRAARKRPARKQR